jgi:hypothetical protein
VSGKYTVVLVNGNSDLYLPVCCLLYPSQIDSAHIVSSPLILLVTKTKTTKNTLNDESSPVDDSIQGQAASSDSAGQSSSSADYNPRDQSSSSSSHVATLGVSQVAPSSRVLCTDSHSLHGQLLSSGDASSLPVLSSSSQNVSGDDSFAVISGNAGDGRFVSASGNASMNRFTSAGGDAGEGRFGSSAALSNLPSIASAHSGVSRIGLACPRRGVLVSGSQQAVSTGVDAEMECPPNFVSHDDDLNTVLSAPPRGTGAAQFVTTTPSILGMEGEPGGENGNGCVLSSSGRVRVPELIPAPPAKVPSVSVPSQICRRVEADSSSSKF